MMNPENRNHKRVRIIVVNDDAMTFESDVLILKYAQAHYGLDRDVSYKLSRLGVSPELMSPEVESYNLINSRSGLGARNVLIFGVVSLYDFGYEEIRKFARSSLKALSGNEGNFKHVSITLHGVGSGLDEMEAFYSEVAGLIDGITSGEAPTEVEQISIVDHNERRVKRLSEALSHLLPRGFIEIDFHSCGFSPRFSLAGRQPVVQTTVFRRRVFRRWFNPPQKRFRRGFIPPPANPPSLDGE